MDALGWSIVAGVVLRASLWWLGARRRHVPRATLWRRGGVATVLAIGLGCLAGLAKLAAEAWYYPEYCGRVEWKCTAGTLSIMILIGATVLAGLAAVTAIGLWIAYLRAR